MVLEEPFLFLCVLYNLYMVEMTKATQLDIRKRAIHARMATIYHGVEAVLLGGMGQNFSHSIHCVGLQLPEMLG